MKDKKIVIAGGSGFIGQEMIRYWGKENSIIVLTRQLPDAKNNRNKYNSLSAEELRNTSFVKWDGRTAGDWVAQINAADLIINLAGKSVNCRYNKKNKKEILDSRVNAVKAIGEAIRRCTAPPELWINAGSATVYRHAPDKPQDEYSTEFQDGFSERVCHVWEETFFGQPTPATRKVALRMAITLGPGGVLIPYFNLLKFGLGGKQGSGKQMFTWIHVEDTCRMIEWAAEHETMSGVYNCCSPHPVSNKEFMAILRKVTGNKFGLPAYTWMLKVGALLIGTETELVLKSRWVVPTKVLESGFTFKYPLLKDAFTEIINKVPRKQYHLF
ncbi:MAG TPA: TIGR01777 family oxidoreductase [Chitinophagaceae bacterium]|nr:TIGR01777 family oxidoreductase [Chitinophagaceae bacterium]